MHKLQNLLQTYKERGAPETPEGMTRLLLHFGTAAPYFLKPSLLSSARAIPSLPTQIRTVLDWANTLDRRHDRVGESGILFAYSDTPPPAGSPLRRDGFLFPVRWSAGVDSDSDLLPPALIRLAEGIRSQFAHPRLPPLFLTMGFGLQQANLDASTLCLSGEDGRDCVESAWGILAASYELARTGEALPRGMFGSLAWDARNHAPCAVGSLPEKLSLAASFGCRRFFLHPDHLQVHSGSAVQSSGDDERGVPLSNAGTLYESANAVHLMNTGGKALALFRLETVPGSIQEPAALVEAILLRETSWLRNHAAHGTALPLEDPSLRRGWISDWVLTQERRGTRLLFILGPSGAGKSAFHTAFIREMEFGMERDILCAAGFTPIPGCEAVHLGTFFATLLMDCVRRRPSLQSLLGEFRASIRFFIDKAASGRLQPDDTQTFLLRILHPILAAAARRDPDRLHYVLLDGLDEEPRVPSVSLALSSLMQMPLPGNLRVLVTSQDFHALPSKGGNVDCAVLDLADPAHLPCVREDLLAYLQQRSKADTENRVEMQGLEAWIADEPKPTVSFRYWDAALHALRMGLWTRGDIGTRLPPFSDSHFRLVLDRAFPAGLSDLHKMTLSALSAIREPIPLTALEDCIQQASGAPGQSLHTQVLQPLRGYVTEERGCAFLSSPEFRAWLPSNEGISAVRGHELLLAWIMHRESPSGRTEVDDWIMRNVAFHILASPPDALDRHASTRSHRLSTFAHHFFATGEYEAAFRTSRVVCKHHMLRGGTPSEESIHAFLLHAEALFSLGRFSDAENILLQLPGKETLHRIGGTALEGLVENRLGKVLHAQGSYDQAEAHYKLALDIRTREKGAYHPETAGTLNDYAGILYAKGAYEQALLHHERARSIRVAALGTDDTDTIRSENNVALALLALGRYKEAARHFDESFSKRKDLLGDNHPETLRSYNNVGLLHLAVGDLPQARACLRRAHDARIELLGDSHPDTLRSIHNMGLLHFSEGDSASAGAFLQTVMQARQTILGADHPDTLRSVQWRALVHEAEGEWEEARCCLERVVFSRNARLGAAHPHTLEAQLHLGRVVLEMDGTEAAESYYPRVYHALRDSLGAGHPLALRAGLDYGAFLSQVGRREEAFALLEAVAAGYALLCLPTHPDRVRAERARDAISTH